MATTQPRAKLDQVSLISTIYKIGRAAKKKCKLTYVDHWPRVFVASPMKRLCHEDAEKIEGEINVKRVSEIVLKLLFDMSFLNQILGL